MSIFENVIEKLNNRSSRPYTIVRFDFTIEGIQDDPSQINVIVDYLSKHEGKWDDFDILLTVEESTFKPYALLVLYLSDFFNKKSFIPMEQTILSKINNTK